MVDWIYTGKVTIASSFPILWLLLIYTFDHFIDFLGSNFYRKPLKSINNDEKIIRELCPRRLDDKSCHIFNNLDYYLSDDVQLSQSCTLNPWFEEEDFRNPKELANKIIEAKEEDPIFFLIKETLDEDELQLLKSHINPTEKKSIAKRFEGKFNSVIGKRTIRNLNECLKRIFDRIIRDYYIWDEEKFASVSLDASIVKLAKDTLDNKNKPSDAQQIKNLELNRLLLEAALHKYLRKKYKINRIWKIMRENVVLCKEQAMFFEFIAVQTSVIYLTKILKNEENTSIPFILFILTMLAIAFWTTTINRSEPYPFFSDTKLRLMATIALLIGAIYFINI